MLENTTFSLNVLGNNFLYRVTSAGGLKKSLSFGEYIFASFKLRFPNISVVFRYGTIRGLQSTIQSTQKIKVDLSTFFNLFG